MTELKGNCLTTGMSIMPHLDAQRALETALSVDIPFWPQLPRKGFLEDAYVQMSEKMPGIKMNPEEKTIKFDLDSFNEELFQFVENWEQNNLDYFRISKKYSPLYHRFLEQDLSAYPAIRGQVIGPISFGMKITDTVDAPAIYDPEVRNVLFEFIALKFKAQYRDLKEKNPNAFVWIDEPGLEIVFMAFSGYTSETALKDYRSFLKKLPGPKGVHLCGNPDWSFLLGLELDILSVDALLRGHILTRYTESLRQFLNRGGIISWGITPTSSQEVRDANLDSLINQLEELWNYLAQHGIEKKFLLSRSWLAPARCCLVDRDGGKTVDKSFQMLKEISNRLRDKYSLF